MYIYLYLPWKFILQGRQSAADDLDQNDPKNVSLFI